MADRWFDLFEKLREFRSLEQCFCSLFGPPAQERFKGRGVRFSERFLTEEIGSVTEEIV